MSKCLKFYVMYQRAQTTHAAVQSRLPPKNKYERYYGLGSECAQQL